MSRPSATAMAGLIALGFFGSYFGLAGTVVGMATGFISGELLHQAARRVSG